MQGWTATGADLDTNQATRTSDYFYIGGNTATAGGAARSEACSVMLGTSRLGMLSPVQRCCADLLRIAGDPEAPGAPTLANDAAQSKLKVTFTTPSVDNAGE